ncbi:MAG TPA: DNA repair protein RadA [Candidatus Saccharimonadia bacterium]|nr:DNA repair protein RadA [Candidatus Saccharimonadia bacterium]
MSKNGTVFICQVCEYTSPKWLGQCPNCNSWNSFEETLAPTSAAKRAGSGRAGRSLAGSAGSADVLKFSDVQESAKSFVRLSSGMEEFDRVMGGGIVLGSVSLLGGEPGIGKSTILTQVIINILNNTRNPIRVMYICGEESPEQIAMRITRMVGGRKSAGNWRDGLMFVTSTSTDECLGAIEKEKPNLVIVDSIQSMQTEDLTGAAGSVGQLKESTLRFTRLAKALHVPIFLVGHVTKEGDIAGPKVLEHIVDSVLELSGERSGFFRLLRSVKNRFGATDEVGVFRVVDTGLEEVSNPSQIFLEGGEKGVPGSAIVPVVEGTRAMLLEVQALVVESQLAMPRRVGRGISLPRIQLLAAVLQKHCHLPLGKMDIFVNAAGGFTIQEPGADLAVAMAIASSYKNIPLPDKTVYVGEIGLLGEVRSVSLTEKRTKEAQRLGYTHVITGKEYRSLYQLVSGLGRANRKAAK